jgi:hypothetical protein
MSPDRLMIKNSIAVEISSLDSNNRIYCDPKTIEPHDDEKDDKNEETKIDIGNNDEGICGFKWFNWISPKSMKPITDDGEDVNNKEPNSDRENDPLSKDKNNIEYSFLFCRKFRLKMDTRIVKSGLKVLAYNQQAKLQKELENREKAYRDEVREGLNHLKKKIADLKI